MLNFYFIILILSGILFFSLFVISALAWKGKIKNSEKIMDLFNIKLFDDPIVVKPKVSLMFMIIVTLIYIIVEILK